MRRNGYRGYSRDNENTTEVDRKNLRLPLEAEIARLICLAQDASDAGKGKTNLAYEATNNFNSRNYKYQAKPRYLLKAIKIINSNPRCGWNYYLVTLGDQNGYPSVIAYVEYKRNDVRLQTSFHTPLNLAEDLLPYVGKGRKTRWDKQIGGSISACKELIEIFDL